MAFLITTPGPFYFTVSQTNINFYLQASGGYEPYTWAIVNGTTLPDGFNFNEATGFISGSANTIQDVTVDFEVTDTNPGGAEVASASILFSVVNAPVVEPFESHLICPLGTPTTATLNITGGNSPYSLALLYSWSGTPPSLDESSIVGSTVELSFTCTVDGAGTAWYRVTDFNGVYYDFLVNVSGIEVEGSNGGLGVPHVYYRDGNITSIITGVFDAFSVDGIYGVYAGVPPYTVVSSSGLPPGDNVDLYYHPGGNCLIEGTFYTQGSYPISFTVEDNASSGGGANNSATFDAVVNVYNPVEITPVLLGIGSINTPYKYKIQDNYIPSDIYAPTTYSIWELGQGLLPTGYNITHDVVTGENFIEGTTVFSNAFPITLAASNSLWWGGVPRDTWDTTLYVGGVVTVVTDPVTLPLYDPRESISIQCTADGGTGPYTWSFGSDTEIPVGLSIDSNTGLITGSIDTGVYPIYVLAFDTLSRVGIKLLTLYAGVVPPVLTDTIPDGCLDTSYSYTLQATGGEVPYEYSIFSGSIPSGLVLNSDGSFVGTPSALGSFTFIVKTTDKVGSSIFTECTMNVNNCTSLSYSICPSTYVELDLTPYGGTGPYTITNIAEGSIPSGMQFSSGSVVTPLLYGTCSVSGMYSFTLSVYDEVRLVTTVSNVSVDVGLKIGLDLGSIPVIRYGETYHHILKVLADKRNQSSFTLSIVSGDLPSGISFVPTLGSPTLIGETFEEGSFEITFSILDNVTGCVVQQEYLFVVKRIYLNVNPPCTKPGLPYKYTLVAGGGVYPYRYHIKANYTLPSDLLLDTYTGLIQGSIYEEGVYVLGIRVFDGRNDYIDKDLTLICSKECLPTTLEWLPSAQSPPVVVGERYFQDNLKRFLPSIFEV